MSGFLADKGDEKSLGATATSISFKLMSSISSGILPPSTVFKLESIDKFKYFDDLLIELCELLDNLIVAIDDDVSSSDGFRTCRL